MKNTSLTFKSRSEDQSVLLELVKAICSGKTEEEKIKCRDVPPSTNEKNSNLLFTTKEIIQCIIKLELYSVIKTCIIHT